MERASDKRVFLPTGADAESSASRRRFLALVSALKDWDEVAFGNAELLRALARRVATASEGVVPVALAGWMDMASLCEPSSTSVGTATDVDVDGSVVKPGARPVPCKCTGRSTGQEPGAEGEGDVAGERGREPVGSGEVGPPLSKRSIERETERDIPRLGFLTGVDMTDWWSSSPWRG